jgi:hypothetical protein
VVPKGTPRYWAGVRRYAGLPSDHRCLRGCRRQAESRFHRRRRRARNLRDAGATACGLPQGSTACAKCAMAHCCSEATACAASLVCNDYESCLAACPQGHPDCRAQCAIDHPTGTASGVSALSACLVNHCENECGLTCGGLVLGVEPDAAAAFQSCIASNGCDPVRACAASTDCDAVQRCVVACPPAPDCFDTCMTSRGIDPAWVLSDAQPSRALGRVAPGCCLPGAPTDPDMQISRIRLFGRRVR